jgi:DNA modification methylase
VRAPRRAAEILHGDARTLPLGGPYDSVVTSPPYPGLIDYHEQHRYA